MACVRATSHLGVVWANRGEHDKALAVYERSLQGVRAMALPDTAMALELQSKALGNQGEALLGAKRYAEAIECYEQRLANDFRYAGCLVVVPAGW